MYSCCNIGCNIVAPEVDDIPGYTRDIYLKRVADYRLYGFSHLEFSHLLSLDLKDASCIREACRSVGIVPWSVHSEHLNEGGEVRRNTSGPRSTVQKSRKLWMRGSWYAICRI